MSIILIAAELVAFPVWIALASFLFLLFMFAYEKEIAGVIVVGVLAFWIYGAALYLDKLPPINGLAASIYSYIYVVVGLCFTVPKWISYSRNKVRAWKELWEARGKVYLESGITRFGNRESFTLYWLNKHRDTGIHNKIHSVQASGMTSDERFTEAKDFAATVEEWTINHWNSNLSSDLIMIRRDSADPTKWDNFSNKPKLAARMTSWIFIWPVHAALLVLNDLIKNAVEWFTEKVLGMFHSITNGHLNSA